MHDSSYNLAKGLIDTYYIGGSVLDVGSCMVEGQTRSYRDFFPIGDYTGVDICNGANVDELIEIKGWGKKYSVDFLVCGQVIEHVERPWEFFREIYNALADHGVGIVIAPSDGQHHPYPKDCYRYFPDGMKALAESAKLRVVDCGKVQTQPWADSYVVVQKCTK